MLIDWSQIVIAPWVVHHSGKSHYCGMLGWWFLPPWPTDVMSSLHNSNHCGERRRHDQGHDYDIHYAYQQIAYGLRRVTDSQDNVYSGANHRCGWCGRRSVGDDSSNGLLQGSIVVQLSLQLYTLRLIDCPGELDTDLRSTFHLRWTVQKYWVRSGDQNIAEERCRRHPRLGVISQWDHTTQTQPGPSGETFRQGRVCECDCDRYQSAQHAPEPSVLRVENLNRTQTVVGALHVRELVWLWGSPPGHGHTYLPSYSALRTSHALSHDQRNIQEVWEGIRTRDRELMASRSVRYA